MKTRCFEWVDVPYDYFDRYVFVKHVSSLIIRFDKKMCNSSRYSIGGLERSKQWREIDPEEIKGFLL
jgi:hypothetical protein